MPESASAMKVCWPRCPNRAIARIGTPGSARRFRTEPAAAVVMSTSPDSRSWEVLAGGVMDGHVQPLCGEVALLLRHVDRYETAGSPAA